MNKNLLICCLLVCLPLILPGQEICDNGIDDDADGLIDRNDTDDCFCGLSSNTVSLIPNASFERYDPDASGCNSVNPDGSPTFFSQLNCLENWRQTTSAGTTDSWNALTFPWVRNNPCFSPPLPVPDGLGSVGYIGRLGPSPAYQEYLSTCLIDGGTLAPDTTYQLRFALGFAEDCTYNIAPGSSLLVRSPFNTSVAVYGIRSCNDINYEGLECPDNNSTTMGWELLGTVPVSASGPGWVNAALTFTPTFPYAGIGIGPDCGLTGSEEIPDWQYYYWMDDLRLNTLSAFNRNPFRNPSIEGNQCDEMMTLTGVAMPDADYQWYRDGIAISGATSNQLMPLVSERLPGNYQLLTIIDGECSYSDPIVIPPVPELPQLPADSFAICPDTPERGVMVSFPSWASNYGYRWSDGALDWRRHINVPGDYSVTVSSPCASAVFNLHVSDQLTPDFTVDVLAQPGCPAPEELPIIMSSDWNFQEFTLRDDAGVFHAIDWPIDDPFFLQPPYPDVLYVRGKAGFCDQIWKTIDLSEIASPIFVTDTILPKGCDSVLFSLNAMGDTSIRYRWEDDNGIFLSDSAVFAAPADGRYTLIISNGSTCSETRIYDNVEADLELDGFAVDYNCGGTRLGASELGGSPPYTYTWLDESGAMLADTNEEIIVQSAGVYTVSVTDAAGCSASLSFNVANENETFSPDLGGTYILETGQAITLGLSQQPSDSSSFSWVPATGLSCTDCPNPTASPTQTTTYTLLLADGPSCQQEVAVEVVINDNWQVYLPTAFSPNDDGLNDTLLPFRGRGVAEVTYFEIFDRWGNLVWATRGDTTGWNGEINGRKAQEGVYVVSVGLVLFNGSQVPLAGQVTLLR